MDEYSGHCHCGAVTWKAQAKPLRNLICHCEDCQRGHSAPMMATLGFARSAVEWTGEIKSYESSPGADRGFCPACGTRLYFMSERWPEEVHISAATLKELEAYKPDRHVVWQARAHWLRLDDDLPKSESFSKEPVK